MNNQIDEKTGLWRARERMVRTHLMARGIQDEVVLKAMSRIPREAFIPEALRDRAYDDTPLPIGDGQTISQPYIVALMTQTLELAGGEKILEIGTGSGYQAAVLGEICHKVFSIERSYSLSARARKILEELGFTNILLRVGDGTVGWAEFSPYDRIVVTAGAPAIPKALSQQLKIGGTLVVPVGERSQQELMIVQRTETDFTVKSAGPCVFVPLIGREGWTS
jgi:protein-L-isoaspartate(D-aspartate) O-methyltransferase